MINDRTERPRALPIADYQPAIARAVHWLGDRYLLATPVNAIRKRSLPATRAKLGEGG